MDSHLFRETLAQFATGIAVVISGSHDAFHGMTVNSFTSVSLNPPLVLFCADNSARTFEVVQCSGLFTVSILAEDQEELSRRFALRSPQAALFASIPTRIGIHHIPYLRDGLAYCDCTVQTISPAGDHHIVVGHVDRLARLNAGRPLLYFQSHYYHPEPLRQD